VNTEQDHREGFRRPALPLHTARPGRHLELLSCAGCCRARLLPRGPPASRHSQRWVGWGTSWSRPRTCWEAVSLAKSEPGGWWRRRELTWQRVMSLVADLDGVFGGRACACEPLADVASQFSAAVDQHRRRQTLLQLSCFGRVQVLTMGALVLRWWGGGGVV